MATERFAFTDCHRRLCLCAGLLLAACHALWPMPRASQIRKGETGAREKIVGALEAFERLLAVSRGADAMGSHQRVREEPWRDAQAAWEKASATLPPPLKGLRRCAVPLGSARGMIERADSLFRLARKTPDPFEAARMLARHERLLKRADVSLRRAGRCYLAVRRRSAAPVPQD